MALPTSAEYAEHLVRLVRLDLAAEPERFGKARSWTDLHEVCDANEYLIDADEAFGLPEDGFGSEERLALMNEATRIAETLLWVVWENEHDPSCPVTAGRIDLLKEMDYETSPYLLGAVPEYQAGGDQEVELCQCGIAGKRTLTLVFDVSGLSSEEIGGLEMEAAVQAEASERHPDVDVLRTFFYSPDETRGGGEKR